VLTIATHAGTNFPPDLAAKCAEYLCKPGSEMQHYFREIAGEEYDDRDLNMRISVATQIKDDEIVPVGWASVYQWAGAPALQCSVFPLYRRRGLASALASVIAAGGDIPLGYVAVFSEHCVRMAKRCGFGTVALFRRVEDGWIKQSEQ
jgi:hypothetical protein